MRSAKAMSAAIGIAIAACSAASSPPTASRPNRDRLSLNAECERCHDKAAAEHRGSLHAVAHTDQSFVRAFRREPLAFCTRCHAPEADPEEAIGLSGSFETRPALAAGVACVSCHLRGDVVLAAPRRAVAVQGAPAPHALRRDPKFAGVEACASCHEFDFPDRNEPMQLTVSEHRASPFARTPCAGCHMPAAAHGFAASRDPDMLRRAARVTASRHDRVLRLEIRPAKIGHAFPTGDLFRRLRVVASAVDQQGRMIRRQERILSRKTKLSSFVRGASHEIDDRPFVDGKVLRVELDLAAPPAEIRWQLVYERVAHPLSLDESQGVVEGGVVIDSGVLPGS
jgi:hypothetical protein